jgi:alkanesulfonate monooxygenase SsuD/methylene tetrahydromethanopterin reductase-like flavin-dependent oxidoreductase (luciferase family)
MKFYFFHLMPYADLDLSFTDKYETSWVKLPNTYYDREKGRALYNRYLDELEYADTLGFDGIGCNEHHQTAYGMMPSPIVIASALSRRTKNAKILILGSAIPLRENPLWLAEEHAMIDTITRGRLITGFVRGIGAEYHATGVNPIYSHDRFHEAHDLIIRAWTEPGPFRFAGKHYHFDYVNVWPRPYQQPHPPIWIPSQGSQETIEWAAHPSRRYTYLQTFSPAVAVARFLKMYRDQAEKYGYEASGDQLGWAIPVYVAETDEIAKREARAHIEAFRNKFAKMPFEMLLPPGYLSMGSMKRVAAAKANLSMEMTLELLDEQGMFIVGSAATVRERLAEAQKQIGFNHLLPLLQFGTLPHELTIKNAKMFAEQVMPQLRPLGEPKVKAKAAE